MEELLDHLSSHSIQAALAGTREPDAIDPDVDPGPLDLNLLAVRGMPSSGKTTLLHARAADVLAAGEPPESILWLDCADMRLRSAGHMLPVLAMDAHLRRNPSLRSGRIHLFLDNVDLIPDWPASLSRLADVYRVRASVAGCDLPPDQVQDAAGGRRVRHVPLLPLDFPSFTRRHAHEVERQRMDGDDLTAAYLALGGLPDVRPEDLAFPAARHAKMQALVQRSLARAVIVPSSPDPRTGLVFAAYALGRPTEPLSVTKAANDMKTQGIPCSRATLAAHLERLERMGIVALAGPYGCEDPGKARVSRSLFAADNALAAAFCPAGPLPYAVAMRNAAYLHVSRALDGKQVFAFKDAPAHDPCLVVADGALGRIGRIVHVIDESADPRAWPRALRMLPHAMLVAGVRSCELVTRGVAQDIVSPEGTIHATPLAEWLMRE